MSKHAADFKALIQARGYRLATFARAMSITPQALNNWLERGIPGARIFDAADALGVSADELRPFTSEGRKPETATDAEIRRFKLMFDRLSEDEKSRLLADLQSRVRR